MKNIGKNIGIGTMALIFMLIIASYFIGINYSKEKAYNGEYRTYTVYKNDTLWNIAQDIDGDTRYIVHIICEDNNLANCGQLQVGQQLKLRVEY